MKINRRSALGVLLVSLSTSLVGSRADAAQVRIIRLNKIKVGGTFEFQLANGAPAQLFRTAKGVFAYQTICTHQGGTTKYFPSKKLLVCPVHKANFDPFNGGKAGASPTASPLAPLPKVKVSVSGGWVVLV